MARRPPGPRGQPLFGSSRRYSRDPFRFLAALERAYGSVARFRMGPMDVHAITEPSAIERVLVDESEHFRKPDFQDDALGDLLGDGLLLSEGDTWRRQRKLANPAFGMARLSTMAGRITDHAESRLANWGPGDVVDVESEMTRVTIDVIADLMMGVELDDATVAHVQRQLEPLGRRFQPNPIRFALPEWVPLPGDAEFDAAVDELESVVDGFVDRRRAELATGGASSATVEGDATAGGDGPPGPGDEPTDLLSLLLRARERGEQTRDQLRDELVTMLLAGHDTTALTLTFTWYLLSEHPAVERRVHAELDEVLAGERPAMEHVRELEYVERVIQEAMRLYPPVYTILRTPTRRFEVDGYTIPPGSTVMLPQWAVHRSERHWNDPERFDPDRWTRERSRGRHRFAYFPFGGGPRHCIGKHLAMLEAQLIVATVASEYHLEFTGDTPIELQPTLTAHPRGEMSMRVEARE